MDNETKTKILQEVSEMSLPLMQCRLTLETQGKVKMILNHRLAAQILISQFGLKYNTQEFYDAYTILVTRAQQTPQE